MKHILEVGTPRARQGMWHIAATVLSTTDLRDVLSFNSDSVDGDLRRSSVYFADPVQRKPTKKRVSQLEDYVIKHILNGDGALPALSVVVLGEVRVHENSVQVVLQDEQYCLIVDGMGRYTAALDLLNAGVTDLPFAVTFYWSESATRDNAAQLLHDFNRYGTSMRSSTSAQFNRRDPLSALINVISDECADYGVKPSWVISDAYLLVSTEPSFFTAQKHAKHRDDVTDAAVEYATQRADDIVHALTETLTAYPWIANTRVLWSALCHAVGRGVVAERIGPVVCNEWLKDVEIPRTQVEFDTLQAAMTSIG